MNEEEKFQERVQKALSEGVNFPEIPNASPLMGLTMAYNEAVNCFVNSGFKRNEAVWLTSAMFCGNPGLGPIFSSGDE